VPVALLDYADLIADEVNVQQVKLVETVGDLAETVLNVIPAALGPRLGARTQHVIAANEEGRLVAAPRRHGGGRWRTARARRIRAAPAPFGPGLSRTLPGEVGIVALDLETTPELEAEGLARDVIRFVQRARRDAGLKVTDRIRLWIGAPGYFSRRRRAWKAHIAAQVLATEIEIAAVAGDKHGPPGPMTSSRRVGELSDGDVVVARVERLG